MAKSARNAPKDVPPKQPCVVQDERSPDKILPLSKETGLLLPLRTVLYVEVQDLPVSDVQNVVSKVLEGLPQGHPHYVVPLRYGKILTDYEFEGEFLDTVKKLCKVNEDGEIVFKDNAAEVHVIRKRFG